VDLLELTAQQQSDPLQHLLWGGLLETILQLLCLIGPIVACTVLLRWFGVIVQTCLMRRFGWWGVVWTAWIGTPLHELSHAATAYLFQRRVDKVVLFQPDPRTNRLGYVRYSHRPDSWLSQIGNTFIATAPLIGGGLALYGLLWLFFPGAARLAIDTSTISQAMTQGDLPAAGSHFAQLATAMIKSILWPLSNWRLWVFGYLVLCIGCHMSPSSTDYAGARRGAIILILTTTLLLVVFNTAWLSAGGAPGALVTTVAPFWVRIVAVLSLGVVLCGVVSLITAALFRLLDQFV